MTSSPAGLEASTGAAIVACIALLAMVVANLVDAGAREALGVLLLVPAVRNVVLVVRGARDERIWAGVGLIVMALVLVVVIRA
jgi:hypothetical protein